MEGRSVIVASGGSDLFGHADSPSEDIFGTFNVSSSNILVASDLLVLFEVGMAAGYTVDNGNVSVKFYDAIVGEPPPFDGFVICPGLNIELLRAWRYILAGGEHHRLNIPTERSSRRRSSRTA
jgi:hypothetical protein